MPRRVLALFRRTLCVQGVVASANTVASKVCRVVLSRYMVNSVSLVETSIEVMLLTNVRTGFYQT